MAIFKAVSVVVRGDAVTFNLEVDGVVEEGEHRVSLHAGGDVQEAVLSYLAEVRSQRAPATPEPHADITLPEE